MNYGHTPILDYDGDRRDRRHATISWGTVIRRQVGHIATAIGLAYDIMFYHMSANREIAIKKSEKHTIILRLPARLLLRYGSLRRAPATMLRQRQWLSVALILSQLLIKTTALIMFT